MADQIKHPGTPRVDACIEAVSKRFPSLKSTAYYEDVHQHIAPLARDMEREIADLRAALQAQQTFQHPDGRCKRWCGDGECKEACANPTTPLPGA